MLALIGLDVPFAMNPVIFPIADAAAQEYVVLPKLEDRLIAADKPPEQIVCVAGVAVRTGKGRTVILFASVDIPHSVVTESEILSVPELVKLIVGPDRAEVEGIPFAKDQL